MVAPPFRWIYWRGWWCSVEVVRCGGRDARSQGGCPERFSGAFALGPNAVLLPFVLRDFQRPTFEFELVNGVVVPAGPLDPNRYGVNWSTDASARTSATVDVSDGGFFGGRLRRANACVRWAPDPRASIDDPCVPAEAP